MRYGHLAMHGISGKGALLLALLLVLVALPACQARRQAACGTSVTSCDVLHGRLTECRGSQSFTFEGVESSLLDFDIRSDEGSTAAPAPRLLDPEGKEIDLAAHYVTARGAATTRVRGVVLLRSGTYQVTVTPTAVPNVYYRFSHSLRFPPVEDLRVTLRADEAHPVTVSAPRGGLVSVQIQPMRGSCTKPQVNGVEDPWGGRALDSCRRAANAPAPKVYTGPDGTYFLNFTAPIPGRYTIMAAAKPGHEGPAIIRAQVRPSGGVSRDVMHPNRAPNDFGIAAPALSGSASDGR